MKSLPHTHQNNKTDHQHRVEAFMRCIHKQQKALGGISLTQYVPESPILPSEEIRGLRARLILEEAIETVQALGYEVTVELEPNHGENREHELDFNIMAFGVKPSFVHTPSLVEIIDGCCDISVVTIGTLSACGVPDSCFLEEIDHNNLAKIGPGSSIREDGKLIKPPGHTPPRIQEMLDKLTQ